MHIRKMACERLKEAEVRAPTGKRPRLYEAENNQGESEQAESMLWEVVVNPKCHGLREPSSIVKLA
jgi:hypothetical protein